MTEKNGTSYATKKELPETKQELLDKIDMRVSKKDFRSEKKRVDGSIDLLANQVTQEIGKLRVEMNQGFDQMDAKFTMVFTAIDGLSGPVRDLITEKAAGEHTLSELEKNLDEHGERIMQLEQKAV